MVRKLSIMAGVAAILAVSASDFAVAREVNRNVNVTRNVNVNRNVTVNQNVNVNRTVRTNGLVVGRSYHGGIWYGTGRRYWNGQWYAYGVGSCWTLTPIGYVWICG